MNAEDLRDTLDSLSGSVRHTDLYERSLRRSRRIGRNRAMAAAGAGLAVLGLAGYGLLGVPRPGPSPDLAAIPTVTVSVSPSVSTSASTSAAPPADRVPGRIFYRSNEKIVRLDPDGTVTALPAIIGDVEAGGPIAVSPDGERIAHVRDGQLRINGKVTDLRASAGSLDDERAPAWSPDGRQLAIAAPGPVLLDLAAGAVTPLPASLGGRDFRWSGDGQRFVYGTADCRLRVAGVGDPTGVTVPLIGDPGNGPNPEGIAACAATSVDRTGDRITVELTDVGLPTSYGQRSDALVDTRTGEVLPAPVPGRADSMLFGPGGDLLVRVADGDGFRLEVTGPDGRVVARADEPAEVRSMYPVAYTR